MEEYEAAIAAQEKEEYGAAMADDEVRVRVSVRVRANLGLGFDEAVCHHHPSP